MDDPKRTVQAGYDCLGSAYRQFYEAQNPDRYLSWLEKLAARVPSDGRILELGCADGIPTARFLSQRFDYLGIDLSPVQIELARRHVPQATFEVDDMTALSVADERFDAVVALYSIIHVPLDEQPALFRSIFRWLKPGGLFLAVLGDRTWTGTEEEWIQSGTLMYWSHADATTYRKWLQEVGFAIHEEALVSEGDGAHVVFFAKKEVVI